ncbi:isochorismatase family cysteine hydrolase [Streptomyces nanshensis]|uniref:isochorismatase family cysteine hydrolase n=1 Tax=Streptomyces nanshensis TaxID=518642 RepID=UPI000B1E5F31|nr:isochorismatase family cysteine hydrolase [Streptomyces nanshensis]
MNPRSAALLVIDVQHGFVNRHSQGVVPAIVDLVKRWQSIGAPAVFTQFRNEPGSPYETITGWTKLRTEAEQAFVGELSPCVDVADAVIDKQQSSAFTQEGTQLIRSRGWTDLVLCGIDTDACVYDTAIDAYQSGVRPWIVTDACASTGGPTYHDAALLLATRNIGADQLLTSKQVLDQIGVPQGGRP